MANGNEKTVDVVFERKNFMNSTTVPLSKYGTLEPTYKEFVRNLTKEQVRNTINKLHFRDELPGKKTNVGHKEHDVNLEYLIDAIKKNNERDTVQKENFVTKVELAMQKLAEVEKLRKHYYNIIKKLPEITAAQNKDKNATVVKKSSITFLKSGKSSTKSK